MLNSMTGFASGRGGLDGVDWTWELRSVNGKGLDLRLRVPDWIEGLEAALRARLAKALTRGNVSLTLRVQTADQAGRLTVNAAQLDDVLAALAEVEARAMARGLSLAPSRPADVLAMRGVLESTGAEHDTGPLATALMADVEALLAAFQDMRRREGAALSDLLSGHLDEIARLTEAADSAAQARRPEAEKALREALNRILDTAEGVDEARIAQELALLAVKADVTEEIGRLKAHVAAARALIAEGSPAGRKLDFLAQEFNREVNTLCSKAQSTALTALGLELKARVDQMREQVQNVE